jgi:mRNA-degrading endonuclease YafQ of YafQ-DinJ toxin-antitoxin module
MRKIEWSNSFKRDYRRTKATPRHRNLDDLLRAVLVLLESDQPLPHRY